VRVGCSETATDPGIGSTQPATIAVKLDKVEPPAQTGRTAVILHDSMGAARPDARKSGMTQAPELHFGDCAKFTGAADSRLVDRVKKQR
jgi:hypothetical protein